MHACGIPDLYRHQAKTIDVIRSGRHGVAATPTSSGKTAIYNLPVLEKIRKNANARALCSFPLRTLAQDQPRTFQEMVALLGGRLPTANIYDGDTTAWHRKRIRESPPNVILTNPVVTTDRNDLGGISTPFHFQVGSGAIQVGSGAIFIYDIVPGGAGLTRLAVERAEELLEYTLKAIQTCPCESGCPSCAHSPKCGSGNRSIDMASARFLPESLKTGPEPTNIESGTVPRDKTETEKKNTKQHGRVHFGVFDLETQRSAADVGGWHKADLMGISCAVLYDSGDDTFYEFLKGQVPLLIHHLDKLDLVVGFNIKRFDYRVLGGCSGFDFQSLPTLDILEEVHNRLGFRISLDHLAKVTLGKKKSAGGLQALQWWKEGRIREIIDYCKLDVAITRDLLLYGKEKGYLLFNNKAGNTVRIPVNW